MRVPFVRRYVAAALVGIAVAGVAGCEDTSKPPQFPVPPGGGAAAAAPAKDAPKVNDTSRPTSNASQDSAITHKAPQ